MNALALELVSELDTTLNVIPFPQADPSSEVERLAEAMAQARETAARDVAADEKLAAASRAALDMLDS